MSRDLVEIIPQRDSASPPFLRLPPVILRSNRNGELIHGLFRVIPWMAADEVGRIYVPVEGAYRVNVFDRAGRHLMAVTRDHTPRPLTERDVEAVLGLLDAQWDTATMLFGLDRAERRRLAADRTRERAAMMPSHLAPVRRLVAMSDGGFWIERIDHRPPAEIEWEWQTGPGWTVSPDHETRWDVTDRDGVFRHAVELPPRFAPFVVTDSSVTGVLRDELDVEYVVTYRVRERER